MERLSKLASKFVTVSSDAAPGNPIRFNQLEIWSGVYTDGTLLIHKSPRSLAPG